MPEHQQILSQQLLSQNSTFEQMLAQMKEIGSKSGKSPVSTPKSVEGGMKVDSWMIEELRKWNK